MLGIPRGPKYTLQPMLNAIDKHLNDPQIQKLAQYPKFLIFGHGAKARDMIVGEPQMKPLWFDPTNDTLVFENVSQSWWSAMELWGPWLSKLKPQHIGLDLPYQDIFHRFMWWSPGSLFGKDNVQTLFGRNNQHAKDVKSLTFFIKSSYEVVTLELESGTSLEPRQWSFSLDLSSHDFDYAMGNECGTAIWKVKLAQCGKQSFWDVLSSWNPDSRTWWEHKVKLLQEEDALHAIDPTPEQVQTRRRKYDRTNHTTELSPLVLLNDGDEKTYLGPNF
jgi:hypothetical protein